MRKQRQDGWTKEEDVLLTETVLRHIQTGKTQLEAFKQAAEALSRTPAACGYRWNATIRQQHLDAIDLARNNRKKKSQQDSLGLHDDDKQVIDSVINMLENIKSTSADSHTTVDSATLRRLHHLQVENQKLQQEVKRYREAWQEMNHVWKWIENSNEH